MHGQFAQQIAALQHHLQEGDRASDLIQEAFPPLHQFFQRHIATAQAPETLGTGSNRFQAIQTEVHKQMRLLALDMMFLRKAHSGAKQALRLQQIEQRLNLLQTYCGAIADVLPPP